MSKENQIIAELEPMAKQAESIEIVDQLSLEEATRLLSNLNKFNDSIEAEQDKVLAPLKEAMKAEKERWAPAIKYYKDGIASIRLKMSTYQTNLVKEQKAQELAITARIAPGKGNLSINTAIKKLESLPTPAKEIPTDAGLVQFREKQQLKVTDITKIAKEYFDLNEARLLADLKSGKLVEGAEIEIIQVPVNYR